MDVYMIYWLSVIFFFNDTATTEIYTLSLHDALPISGARGHEHVRAVHADVVVALVRNGTEQARDIEEGGEVAQVPLSLDRKSTRLNSSHANISYAVFCLKKKKILLYTTLYFWIALSD